MEGWAPDVAVAVSHLGKCYRIYEHPQDRLKQALFRGRRQYYREFWALRDVSLEVRRGETVGIMGRNGCGKSTLLQMVCGTLHPTTGQMHLAGRIAALLELGAGFNPEFSGRDNVYTNGTHTEMDARFDPTYAPFNVAYIRNHVQYCVFGNHDSYANYGQASLDDFYSPIPVLGVTSSVKRASSTTCARIHSTCAIWSTPCASTYVFQEVRGSNQRMSVFPAIMS